VIDKLLKNEGRAVGLNLVGFSSSKLLLPPVATASALRDHVEQSIFASRDRCQAGEGNQDGGFPRGGCHGLVDGFACSARGFGSCVIGANFVQISCIFFEL